MDDSVDNRAKMIIDAIADAFNDKKKSEPAYLDVSRTDVTYS
jgi:hypothetical protein